MSMLSEPEGARRAWTRLSRNLTEKRALGKRTCSKCKELKSPAEFYKRKKETVSQCKACMNETRRAWRAANPERDRETCRRYVARQRAKKAA